MTKKKERKLQTYTRHNVIIEHRWPVDQWVQRTGDVPADDWWPVDQWVQRTGDVPADDYNTVRIEGYWLNTLGCPMVSLYGVPFDMYLDDFERLHEPAEVMVFGVYSDGARTYNNFNSVEEARVLLEDDEDRKLIAFVSVVGGTRVITDYVDDLSRK